MRHEDRGDEETTRSGLFFEAIRVIKEMREHDKSLGRTGKSIRPRYAIYENVPGALSSPGGENKGADWQAVVTELVRVVEPEAPDVPMPEAGWAYADCLYGVGADGVPFSLAWRLTDAQYFGVAQRRARLCVLVDYAGLTAPWILLDGELDFATENGEPLSVIRNSRSGSGSVSAFGESLSGNPEQSFPSRERTAGGTEVGIGEPSEPVTLKIRGGREIDSAGKRAGKGALIQRDMSATLGVSQDQTLIQPCLNPWDVQSKHIQPPDGIAEALYSGECRYGGGESYAFTQNQRDEVRDLGEVAGCIAAEPGMRQQTYVAVDVYNQTIEGEVSPTVTAAVGGSNTSGPKIMSAAGFKGGNSEKAYGIGYEQEMSPTIPAANSGTNQAPTIVMAVDCRNGTEDPEINGTLQAKPNGGISYNLNNVVRTIPIEGNGSHSLNGNNMARTVAYGIDQQGGKGGANYAEEVMPTILSDSHGTPHGVATIPLEGNGSRPSHFGAGYGKNGDPSFTLNHVEQHGVAVTYDARGNGDGKTACTLTGDHQDRVTDYTALVVKADGVVSKGNGEAWTTPERATSVTVGGGQAGQGYPAALVTTDEAR